MRRKINRDAELAAIERWVSEIGATYGPVRFAAHVSAALPVLEEKRRIAELQPIPTKSLGVIWREFG